MGIRVFLVEPSPIVREGLRACLAAEKDVTVSGAAPELRAALPALTKGGVDVVLVNESQARAEDGDPLHHLLEHSPRPAVLILSEGEDAAGAERLLQAGVTGYVSQNIDPEALVNAIRSVAAGEVVASPRVMADVLRRLRRGDTADHDPVALLSEREREIFQLTGQGLEAKEIADRLTLSPRTVDVHRANIRNKLGIRGAHELMRYAMHWEQNGRMVEQLRSFCRERRPLLLVEDDEVDVLSIKRALNELRSETPLVVTRNGEEALAYLRNETHAGPFLILLDINMPRMDGHEFLAELRKDKVHGSTPVVALSSSEHEEDKARMYGRGVTGYLVKPNTSTEYMEMFRTLAQFWAIIAKPGDAVVKPARR